jgi:pSer/pThr/pTyr-binding forkhead associated (FHA) protein
MTRLIMRRGPNPSKIYELSADVMTIGSGTKNNIVILDNDISREHCRLIRVMADYELHDLSSVRGTFVNGQRVKGSWLLKPGSIIELGENVTLEYERDTVAAELEKVHVPVQPHPDKPDPNAHPSLVMTIGSNAGLVYPLKTRTINIGRDLSNDIVVQDPEVSRFHLTLHWADTSYQLEDLGSTNGTLLNGAPFQPNTPTMLHANDLIQIATLAEFRFTWQPDDVQVERPHKPRAQTTGSLGTHEIAQIETNEAKLFAPTNKRQTSRLGTGLQPGALVDHIFIAYAREEWESIVAPLTVILQDAGQKVWVDQYLVQGGDDWLLAVEQALSECWFLLVVVSPEALNARHVRLAYRYFFNREKPVIPLLYANVDELPLELRNLKVIRYDSQNRKRTFDELVAEIQSRQRSR